MALEKIGHYSMTTPASVYDEEALTALELAGRTAAKTNEAVEAFNALEETTLDSLHQQDDNIRKMNDETMPAKVTEEVQAHIDNGDFDRQIDESLGGLNERVNNLLGSLTTGSTTSDAELIDLRVDADGVTYTNAGEAIRANQIKHINYITDDLNNYTSPIVALVNSTATNIPVNATGVLEVTFTKSANTNESWVLQKWYSYNKNSVYYRTCNGGVWSAWFKNDRKGISLIKDDLNNYFSESLTGVADISVLNSPDSTQSGLLEVEVVNGTDWCTQTWTGINTSDRHIRIGFSSGGVRQWRAWTPASTPFYTFIEDDMNNFVGTDLRGIALGTALNVPENNTAFVEVMKFGTTRNSNPWVMQKWYGFSSGNMFYRWSADGVTWGSWYAFTQSSDKPLTGKTVVFLGDSIFGNNRTAAGIPSQFAKLTGATVYNFGFGGTRGKSRTENNGWNYFDGELLSQAIASGDYTNQINAIPTMSGVPGYFTNVINEMKNFDFSTVDYIICNYGTNDYTGGSTSAGYLEAVKTIITNILTAYPNIVFVKCTAAQRFIEYDGGLVSGAEQPYLVDGETLKAFVDADLTLKDSMYLDVVDMLHMNINLLNRHTVFDSSDYTHFNAAGNRYYAERLANNF